MVSRIPERLGVRRKIRDRLTCQSFLGSPLPVRGHGPRRCTSCSNTRLGSFGYSGSDPEKNVVRGSRLRFLHPCRMPCRFRFAFGRRFRNPPEPHLGLMSRGRTGGGGGKASACLQNTNAPQRQHSLPTCKEMEDTARGKTESWTVENEPEAEAEDSGEAQDRTETQRTQKRKCCPTGLYKVSVAQGCGFQMVTAASIITTSIMSRSILIIITPLVCLAGDPDLAARLARPKEAEVAADQKPSSPIREFSPLFPGPSHLAYMELGLLNSNENRGDGQAFVPGGDWTGAACSWASPPPPRCN